MNKEQLITGIRQYRTYLMLYRGTLRPNYLEAAKRIFDVLEGELFYHGISIRPQHRIIGEK